MIIFDLDGTLADCEHRRHFVDPSKNPDYEFKFEELSNLRNKNEHYYNKITGEKWKPDYQSFYEACDKDEPIEYVIEIFQSLIFENHVRLGNEVEIWSGRCESVREKTQDWLDKNVWGSPSVKLKMRPIGDNRPTHRLKEEWYDLHNVNNPRQNIEMVFDADRDSIAMWKRRGIFVFDCRQS